MTRKEREKGCGEVGGKDKGKVVSILLERQNQEIEGGIFAKQDPEEERRNGEQKGKRTEEKDRREK